MLSFIYCSNGEYKKAESYLSNIIELQNECAEKLESAKNMNDFIMILNKFNDESLIIYNKIIMLKKKYPDIGINDGNNIKSLENILEKNSIKIKTIITKKYLTDSKNSEFIRAFQNFNDFKTPIF